MKKDVSREIPSDVKLIFDKADCAGPASEELVNSVERYFGLEFPPSYRAFLRCFGAALMDGFEIYGLVECANITAPPVWSGLRSIGDIQRCVGRRLLPVSDDGGDYRFYLLAKESAVAWGEAIVAWGPGCEGLQVSSDVFDFVVKAAKDGALSLIPDTR